MDTGLRRGCFPFLPSCAKRARYMSLRGSHARSVSGGPPTFVGHSQREDHPSRSGLRLLLLSPGGYPGAVAFVCLFLGAGDCGNTYEAKTARELFDDTGIMIGRSWLKVFRCTKSCDESA